MTATTGNNTKVYMTGASVAVTAEACSLYADLGANDHVYQVTNSARRAIDPSVAVVVYDNAVAVDAGDYEVDYLYGKIRFSLEPTGPVTADFSYLALWEITTAKELAMDVERAAYEETPFGSTARRRCAGLFSASGSIGCFDSGQTDYDTGGGTLKLGTVLSDGTAKLIEGNLDGAGKGFRAWVLVDKNSIKSTHDSLQDMTVNFQSEPQREGASFAWSADWSA